MATQKSSDGSNEIEVPDPELERGPDAEGSEVTISESDLLAMQSLQAFQDDLEQFGYSSVFDVIGSDTETVTQRLQASARSLAPDQAVDFYDRAQNRAASLTRLYAQLCSRSDPAMLAVPKLGVQYDSDFMTRSLGGTGSYGSWFSPASGTQFSHPDSVGSLFSPASYLTDLYRAAKPLHPAAHGLQLNRRRPDLASLALSEANLHEEVSTLALTLEVLEAGVDGNVDELLRTAVYPMNLPYNAASDQILQGMAVRKSNPAEVWSVFKDYEDQALRLENTVPSWATRMPVAYARDALGMSPELLNILTENFTNDFDAVGKYYGKKHNDYIYYESVLRSAIQLPTETILEALGAGPFYNPSIVTAQTYGARYINGWSGGNQASKPFYWYIGAALGHPVPRPINDPASSLLYHRTNAGFGRLNRLIRLQSHVKVLSYEELDWFISQASDDISVHPLTQPLQALAIYLPLRQRYAMTVDSFAACLGVLNTFYASGKTSFYSSLFGATDLIGQRNIDFQRTTEQQASMSVRARLCQGLQIDDASLCLLAQSLPGMVNNTLAVLGLEQISALYRLVAIPRLFGLRVVEAVHLWELLGTPNAIVSALAQPKPNQIALAILIRTGYLVDWMRVQKLDAAQLIALTSRRYPVQTTPELQAFIENVYSTLTGREPVPTQLRVAEDEALRGQLARHIGAEFGLKPNVALAMLVWVDAVAKDMAPTLEGYGLLKFWEDIERICQGLVTLESRPQVVQYVHLLRQFAQVCNWAQLGEQDLELLLPVAQSRPSALTGAGVAPPLTLNLLLVLSRYRQWQSQLIGPVAEARGYLQRAAQSPVLTPQVAAQLLSDLHGWDVNQTLALMGTSVPANFVALQPLLQKMQLSQRLNLSPTDLLWVAKLTATSAPAQATLNLIAAKVIAAAHG